MLPLLHAAVGSMPRVATDAGTIRYLMNTFVARGRLRMRCGAAGAPHPRTRTALNADRDRARPGGVALTTPGFDPSADGRTRSR